MRGIRNYLRNFAHAMKQLYTTFVRVRQHGSTRNAMEVACIYTGHLDRASYAYFITHVIPLFAIVIA